MARIPKTVALLALCLATVAVVRRGLDFAPVTALLQFGLDPAPAPTGRIAAAEGVRFVEIGAGAAALGARRPSAAAETLVAFSAALGVPTGTPPVPSPGPCGWTRFERPFWIAETELTNAAWQRFDPELWIDAMKFDEFGEVGSRYEWPSGPRVELTASSVRQYGDWYRERTGIPVRLPTEAEWEVAAHAGGPICPSRAEIARQTWKAPDLSRGALPVGHRAPNAFGLHDMIESVAEMCAAEDVSGDEAVVFRGGTFRDRPEDRHTLRQSPAGPLSTGFRPAFSLASGEEELVEPWLVPANSRSGHAPGD